MLVDFHLIQNHAPSNLNRDDTGSPKEALFGGSMRARISSQCLKRSLRQSEIFRMALADGRTTDSHLARRSRQLGARVRPELARLGCPPEAADVIVRKASSLGSGKESDQGETRQTMFLADQEVSHLAEQLYALYQAGPGAFVSLSADDLEKRIASGSVPRSVDIALFGRMTTSALFEDVTAAMQVAHALGTGRAERQFDYFTAVDDWVQGDTGAPGRGGADMIGDVEFNSATYYKYFSLDWSQLLKNLGGDEEIARRTLRAVLMAAALATPTGKQNAFAAHNPPDAILVEVKPWRVPISYANAFVKPVRPTTQEDLVEVSLRAFTAYVVSLKKAYGLEARSYWLTTRGIELPGTTAVENLEALGRAVLSALPVADAPLTVGE
jgi:CRISPR system Cascade subunit CasC